jgi:hypothetical protein
MSSFFIGVRGISWHTFHFLISHIMSVLAKMIIRARLANNTLRLQSDLHNFHATSKEVEGKAFPLTSERVSTCLS